jgi:hypothetical protein
MCYPQIKVPSFITLFYLKYFENRLHHGGQKKKKRKNDLRSIIIHLSEGGVVQNSYLMLGYLIQMHSL